MVRLRTLVVLASTRLTLGEMSCDRGRPIVMQGAVAAEGGGERCRLSIEIERIGFVLNTVQGRYRLARLRFENLGTTAVALSVERDTLEADAGPGGTVPAVLNLQSGDSPFWDALSPDMRQVLAYPKGVKARPSGTGSSPEVVYIYALFPADKVPGER